MQHWIAIWDNVLYSTKYLYPFLSLWKGVWLSYLFHSRQLLLSDDEIVQFHFFCYKCFLLSTITNLDMDIQLNHTLNNTGEKTIKIWNAKNKTD